jgi:hypothetical protein
MNKKILLLILFLLIFFVSGCTMLEIEDYAIVAGIGIDLKDNEYEVIYEIYSLRKCKNGYKIPYEILNGQHPAPDTDALWYGVLLSADRGYRGQRGMVFQSRAAKRGGYSSYPSAKSLDKRLRYGAYDTPKRYYIGHK